MAWFHNRDGEKLWYEDSGGNGAVILFIHGWCMSSVVWKFQYEGLGGVARIVAPDLRGHGRSGHLTDNVDYDHFAADVEDLIKFLKVENVFLAGWSLGAQVALKTVLAAECVINGIIMISATPCFTNVSGFNSGIPLKDADGMRVKVQRNMERAIRGFCAGLFYGCDPEVSEESLKLLESVPLPGKDAALAALEALVKADLRDILPSVSVPCLIISGDLDRVCLPAASQYLYENIKGSRYVILPMCGHAPFLSHSKLFNGEIIGFLRSISE